MPFGSTVMIAEQCYVVDGSGRARGTEGEQKRSTQVGGKVLASTYVLRPRLTAGTLFGAKDRQKCRGK